MTECDLIKQINGYVLNYRYVLQVHVKLKIRSKLKNATPDEYNYSSYMFSILFNALTMTQQ